MHRLAHLLPEGSPDYLEDAKSEAFNALDRFERALDCSEQRPIFCIDCGVQIFDYEAAFCEECSNALRAKGVGTGSGYEGISAKAVAA